MRCKLRPQALTLVAIIVSPIVMMVYAFYAERQDNSCHAVSRSNEDLQAVSYYCNFNDLPVSGSEGDVKVSGLKLEQVQFVIRHGDRSSIHTLPNYFSPQLSCSLYDYPHLKQHTPHLDHLEAVLSQNAWYRKLLPASLVDFTPYPDEDLCGPGQLTPTGAAQQVKNGAFLYDSYKKWNIIGSFNDSKATKPILLVTTKRERTFQSGLAFLFGLIPLFNLTEIEVLTAINQSMCVSTSKRTRFACGCQEVENYHSITAQTYGFNLARENAGNADDVEEMAHKEHIAKAFGISPEEIPSKQSILDVGMTHACHRLPLPGSRGKCMDIGALRHIAEEAKQHGRTHATEGHYPKIAKLRMLPLLDQIHTSMADVAYHKEVPKIIVYSGHDSTLDPLLVALNISTGEWPKYAARVTFELYSYSENISVKSYFFRILNNGQDRTTDALKCKAVIKFGICPLNVLDEYLESHASSCSSSKGEIT